MCILLGGGSLQPNSLHDAMFPALVVYLFTQLHYQLFLRDSQFLIVEKGIRDHGLVSGVLSGLWDAMASSVPFNRQSWKQGCV